MSAPRYTGYFTTKQAAAYLKVSERTVRELVWSGNLRVEGPKRPYRIPADQLTMTPHTTIESPFYTVAEAMAYLRLSRKTVDSLIKRGLLRCSAAIRHKRILKEDVHSFHARTAPRPFEPLR